MKQSNRSTKILPWALFLIVALIFTISVAQAGPAQPGSLEATEFGNDSSDVAPIILPEYRLLHLDNIEIAEGDEDDFLIYLPVAASRYPVTQPENTISNIVLDPPSPASLSFWDRVNITFDYTTAEQDGVLIWAQPFTNGGKTPNYGYAPSPVYPHGEGSGTGFIFIVSGDVTVDQIRFQMKTAGERELVYELFVPVEYQYSD